MRVIPFQKIIIAVALFLGAATFNSTRAHAGIFDISYTYSQRSSFIDDDNYQKSLSHTASIAWYFLDLSAIELSYTNGEGQVSGKAQADPSAVKYITRLDMYDASLVITFAAKDWAFQPYIKGGGAMVDKRIYRTTATDGTQKISHTDKDEIVPSLGAGFKIYFTPSLSLRAGYDRWRTGKSGDKEVWDDAIRAGFSFNF